MLVKIKLCDTPQAGQIVDIARFVGCAPCQIIAVNGVRNERELLDHYANCEIWLPIVTKCLVKKQN